MNRRTFAAAGMSLFGFGCARAQAPDVPGLVGEVLKEHGVPALAGAVVTPEGVAWLDAGGLRRADASGRVTKADLWHIGSNTKAMTAALYARAVQQGRARWSATVPELFPDVKTDPAWAKTTIEDLLSHRSGVSDAGLLNLRAAHADERPVPEQRGELAANVFGAAPNGKPGEFAYSNVNYVLAGAALERLLGVRWEEAITRELFRPLGMASPGFGAPQGAQPWGHSDGLFGVGGGPVDPTGLADNPPILGPAGRVHLSLADYAKFVRLFLTEGGGYLAPESSAKLTTPPAGSDYALGWGVRRDRPWAQGPLLGHAGSNTMWVALAQVAPARGVAILTVTNSGLRRGEPAVRALADRLIARYAPG